jgi:lipopolysaccharide/colanic/teichoic acid biosynthesis glycosyltransferase
LGEPADAIRDLYAGEGMMADSRARNLKESGSEALLAGGFGPAEGNYSYAKDIALDVEDSEPLLRPGQVYVNSKRIMDIIVSIGALFVFGLFLPMIALIIKLDSKGSVFYSQDRVGVNRRSAARRVDEQERRKVFQPGRPFRVHKLRTMGVNAEANGPQLAQANDMRITRVGRVLRKTRLDEVPQFWNVLKGEMSLIGPRPERLVFVRHLEKEIPNYRERLFVLPGITGLAQVLNGYDEDLRSVRRKVDLDRRYIRNAGFRQDGKILVSTVGVVLKGEGAR